MPCERSSPGAIVENNVIVNSISAAVISKRGGDHDQPVQIRNNTTCVRAGDDGDRERRHRRRGHRRRRTRRSSRTTWKPCTLTTTALRRSRHTRRRPASSPGNALHWRNPYGTSPSTTKARKPPSTTPTSRERKTQASRPPRATSRRIRKAAVRPPWYEASPQPQRPREEVRRERVGRDARVGRRLEGGAGLPSSRPCIPLQPCRR